MSIYDSYDVVTAVLKEAEKKLLKLPRCHNVEIVIDKDIESDLVSVFGICRDVGLYSWVGEDLLRDRFRWLATDVDGIDQMSVERKIECCRHLPELREAILEAEAQATQDNLQMAAEMKKLVAGW